MYDEIIKRYRPRGWRIVHTKRKDELAVKTRRAMARGATRALPHDAPSIGECDPFVRKIYCPTIVDPLTLQIALHEIAHVLLSHLVTTFPTHQAEFEAERWSFEIMRQNGIPVSRGIKRMSTRYIKHCIRNAERAGHEVPRHIRKFGEHHGRV